MSISIKLPKWLLEDAEKACQNNRQFQSGDGSLNVNKFGIEAFILKVAELKGDKIVLHKETSLILEGFKRGLKSD